MFQRVPAWKDRLSWIDLNLTCLCCPDTSTGCASLPWPVNRHSPQVAGCVQANLFQILLLWPSLPRVPLFQLN